MVVADSIYKGVNLLDSIDLDVTFNEDGSSSLTIDSFDATFAALATATPLAQGLDFTEGSADLDTALSALDEALTTLRSQSQALSSNLSIVTSRLDFTTNMINTLNTGADNLTLADMNEESANMLMLETRQSLGTTALSLASDAAQAILRLFQ